MTMEHFQTVHLFFLGNLSSFTVIQDYTVITDIRVGLNNRVEWKIGQNQIIVSLTVEQSREVEQKIY